MNYIKHKHLMYNMTLAKGITTQHDALNVSYYAKLMHGKVNEP